LDIKQELKKGNIVTIIDSTLDFYKLVGRRKETLSRQPTR